MIIVWDEPKRRQNLAKHGLDFAALTSEFFLDALVGPAREDRFKAMGRLGDGIVAVVFARRGAEGVSVISLRPASKTERTLYDQATGR
ncbi:BrnT family toxin [uncultured Rhodospira sp.]|uniref:BrnT family toxin n=1 Tax=uncultured Rhodospira sp. TaxID=1936189 RepID=UPI002610F910|nr:BrnT family toxin [uncultured Rhodospira sp.]